jgi:tRNA(Ile)-lysidine synthetase-like protein
VEEVAARLGLPFAIRHLDADPHATPAQLRTARYEALVSIASASQAFMIATAHQAQDQLETVLAALVRGTGPRGLVGMPAMRPLSDNISLVRPMLEVDRSAAGELCTLAGLTWCDDPTNVDPKTLRGRLRRDVLPVLESLRPGVASRLASGTAVRAAASLALDNAVVRPQEMGDAAVQWGRDSLAEVGKGLCQASLMATARSMVSGSDGLSSASILAATTAILDTRQHRRVFELGCGVVAIVDAMRVRMQKLASTQPIESRPPK